MGDEERQVRIRRLAKIAEERWITQQQRPAEQLDIINSKNELDGVKYRYFDVDVRNSRGRAANLKEIDKE